MRAINIYINPSLRSLGGVLTIGSHRMFGCMSLKFLLAIIAVVWLTCTFSTAHVKVNVPVACVEYCYGQCVAKTMREVVAYLHRRQPAVELCPPEGQSFPVILLPYR